MATDRLEVRVQGFALLACLRCHHEDLMPDEGAWGEIVDFDDIADGSDWTSMVHAYAGRGEHAGLVALSFAGC